MDQEPSTFVPVLPTVPALDRSRVTHVLDAYGFLLGTVMYGGAIEERRAAHLRGRVRALSRTTVVDLAGADVRILDRPDAPITRSRNDGGGNNGVWDLLVNGGGPVTVSFSAPGYVASQRVVEVGWNDEVTVPDVVLVPEPACVTVNGSTGGLYTHSSWTVSDGRGARTVVAYIPPGTEARYLGGPASGPTTFDLCWTEMTRRVSGVRDDAFMPADIATGTAYTFAGEGRVRVSGNFLSQPYFAPVGSGATGRSTISMYLRTDTFSGGGSNLDLAVGTTVPVGSYDERRGLWGPELDGVFVQVNSPATGCIATGGAPVTIPTAEVNAVCAATASFPDGSRYMRVPIGHFSPTDWNLIGALNFLENIFTDDPGAGSCESTQGGSIVYCERRALGEQVPVHGTGYSLSYNSANQAGRLNDYTVRVTAGGSGTDVPTSVNVSMEVAGRTVATTSTTFGGVASVTWDGNDAFGRRMLGPQRADIWVEYVFNTEYLCQNPTTPGRSFQDRLAGFTVDCGAREARLRYRRTRWVGVFDDLIRGLGGWSISDHHIYDPVTRVLSMGDGTMRTDATTGWVASADASFPTRRGIAVAAAPDGTVYFASASTTGGTIANQIHRFSASGVLDPTVITVFTDLSGLAVGPEGELYVGRMGSTGGNDGCIVRLRSWTNSTAAFEPLIGACGTVSTSVPAQRSPLVCEACGTPASGPNQVATARVHIPRDMAVSPDGVLAYTDLSSGAIGTNSILFYREFSGTRMLSLFRTASTALGPVVFDRQARMYWSIQTGSGGTDPWLVRRLDDDADPGGGGVISDGRVVLGGGSNVADGVLATGTSGLQLAGLRGLGVLPTGELIAVQSNRIRMVGLDQRVRTIAGCAPSGSCAAATAIESPGRRTAVAPNTGAEGGTQTVAVTPSGTVLFANGDSQPVFALRPALPAMGTSAYRIPSSDASLIYEFDSDGRHLYTRDAITDTVLLTFQYNAAGRLQSIADAENVATTVTYTSSQIQLTSPGPNTTTLFVGTLPPQYAYAVISGGRTWDMNLGGAGLLTSYREPGEPQFQAFTYLGDGRLDTDVDLTDAGGTGGASLTLSNPVDGTSRVFRQRNTTPAASVMTDYRWGTITDPGSTSAGAWQRFTDAYRVDGTASPVGVRSANPRTVFTQYPEEVRVDHQILSGTTWSAGQPVPGALVTDLGTTRLELAGDPRFDMESPYVSRSRFCVGSSACNDSSAVSWTSTDEMVVDNSRSLISGGLRVRSTLQNGTPETTDRDIMTETYGRRVVVNPPGTGYPDTVLYTSSTGLVRAVAMPGQHPICLDYTGRRVSAIRQGAYTISSGVCTGSPATTRSITYAYDPTRRWLTGVTTGGTQTTTITPHPDRGWPQEIRLPARNTSDPVLVSYFDTGTLQYVEGPGRSSAGRYNYTYTGRNLFDTESTPLGLEVSNTDYNLGRTPQSRTYLGTGTIAVTSFDAAGLPATVTASQSTDTDTWTVLYDGAERPTSIAHSTVAYGSRPGTMGITYNGPLLATTSWSTTPGQAATVAFAYETRTMRLSTETVTNESTNAVIGYSYAPTLIGSSGAAVTGTFSRNGASSSWTLGVPTPTVGGTPARYPTSVLTVAGSAATATTNRATQFGEMHDSVTGTTSAPWFIERVCARDGHGRVTSRTEWVRTGTNLHQRTRYTYAYDAAGRLGGTARYQSTNVAAPLDSDCPTSGGTLVSGSARFWTYNDAGIRSDLTAGTDDQVSTGTRTYDVRGRLSKVGSGSVYRTYTHDVQGRLRRSAFTSIGTTTTTYEYDPLGRLAHIDPNGTADDADDEYFWYRDGLRPIAWQRGVGASAVHAYFVYVTRSNVPELMYVDNTGTTAIDAVYRLVTDERGSVRVVLQVSGTPAIVQQLSYDEWGVQTVELGSTTLHPFGFAGGIRMGFAGLWHFGARNYDTAIGQWIEKDPIEYAGGTGPYLYCENDPVNHVDPDGRNPILIGALTGGIASFIISVGLHSLDGSLCGDFGSILDDTAMGIVSGALFGWFLPGATGIGKAFFGQGSAGSRLFGGALAGAASNVVTTAIGDALGSSPTGSTYAASAALGVAGGIGSVGLAPSLLGRAPANLSWGAGTGATGRALNADIAHYALASELWGFLGGAPGNLPAE